MRRICSALSLLLISLLFLQCQREVSHIGGPDNNGQIVTPEPITAALQGNIVDENGDAAAGVTVQAGNRSATTDANGYFRINNAALDKSSAVVTASKAGYFKAYRTFGATSGSNHIEIKLVKRTSAGAIDAGAGGEVSLSNGTKVVLPANGVVNAATNAAYTGQVTVYAAYIDPGAADIAQTVPGSFMATDKDGKRVVLTSYGMVAVELQGASGEKLQVKNGSTATLTTAIPAAAQASAPATIPLWSVDETTGIWKEEGTATKNGNVYVGQVKHFSFWNCDVSQNAVKLNLTLKLQGGESFVHAQVRIKRSGSSWNNVSYGRTDSIGQVSGYVPYNEPLVLEVLDPCGQPLYSQNIGPFTQNSDLGVITVSSASSSVVTVRGKLMTCSNSSVVNGFALISFGNYTHYASVDAAGNFQTTFTRCGSSPTNIEVVGIDNATQQQGTVSTSVAVVTPVTNVGNISACGTSSAQFINFTLDGTAFAFSSNVATDSLNESNVGGLQWVFFQAFRLNNNDRLTLAFSEATPGNFRVTDLRVNAYDSTTLVQPFAINFTTLPQSIGQYYEGSFGGSFTSNSVTHTINGTFRMRRTL